MTNTDSHSKKSSQIIRTPAMLALLGVTVIICILWNMLFPPRIAQWVRSLFSEQERRLQRVELGQDRAKALQAYSDAWYHGVCKIRGDLIFDVFLYGQQSSTGVEVLVVKSQLSDSRMGIVDVSAADRDLLREYGFESCVPGFLLSGGTPTAASP